MAYNYDLKYFSIGAKANYLIGDLHKGAGEITTPLIEINPLTFELMLKIHLFKINRK